MRIRNKQTGEVLEGVQRTARNLTEMCSFAKRMGMSVLGGHCDLIPKNPSDQDIFVHWGDWLIKDQNGKLSVCKESDFQKKWKLV